MTSLTRVSATDGLDLAVYDTGYPTGDPAAPTILAIHGYPDDARVWDPVVDLLRERFRVVRYDVRGAGRSGTPASRAGYRLEQLEADLTSVLEAVSPDRPVHLLAHDWGSIQGWQCVTSPRLRGRIASYTSISGPGLAMAGRWLRTKLRPSAADLATLARQFGRSWYLVAFQVPGLAELGWRSGLLDRLLGRSGGPDPTALANRLNGLQLYRANRQAAGRPVVTDIPVLVLAPSGDRYVGVPLQTEAPAPYASDLRVRVVPGGHWIMRREPELVARACAELVDEAERTRPA